jgi:hypothetical protein
MNSFSSGVPLPFALKHFGNVRRPEYGDREIGRKLTSLVPDSVTSPAFYVTIFVGVTPTERRLLASLWEFCSRTLSTL